MGGRGGSGLGGWRESLARRVLDHALGALDVEVVRIVLEGEVELRLRSGTDLADPDPHDVARSMCDFDPLSIFPLEN
jgi:hypothetical protein